MKDHNRVTRNMMRYLLVSAFEGGSNYWYMIEHHDYTGI
jgi:hypothetical protein